MRASQFASIASSISLAVAACATSGCTHAVDDGAAPAQIDGDVFSALADGDPAGSGRFYVGEPAFIAITDEAPTSLGVFDLNPGARVRIDVDAFDGTPGFKAYAVGADGALSLLGVVDGRDGHAAAVLRTRHGGTFAVEAAASGPTTLELDLTCKSRGDCTPRAQPGDLCADGVDTCDLGLYCHVDDASCGASIGVCEVPWSSCEGTDVSPVCGCDGKTYDNACGADAAGINVASDGACACDPLAFRTHTGDPIEVTGVWVGFASNDGYNIASRLLLNSDDATFRYEQTWEPKCLHSVPACRIATRLLSMDGSWVNQGFAVQLTPTVDESAPVSPDLAQSFLIEDTCEGGLQLATTEDGLERALTRDPCMAARCSSGTHCEAQQVQCIRAPCNPVATCIAD